MTISEIKKTAKENVRFQWGNLLLAFMICTFLATVSNAVPGIGAMIVAGPLVVGFYHMYYEASQKRIINQWDIFKGFEECFGESLLMMLLVMLFTFLWSLLFIIPGIIKGYSYSMAPYLMMREKNLTATESIKKSMEYMKGEKWHLFVLQLSFIGWILLTCITFGLAGIYVFPYMEQAEIVFYNNVYDKRKADEAARAYYQAGGFTQAPAEENAAPNETVIDAEFRTAADDIDPKFVIKEDDSPKMEAVDPFENDETKTE